MAPISSAEVPVFPGARATHEGHAHTSAGTHPAPSPPQAALQRGAQRNWPGGMGTRRLR